MKYVYETGGSIFSSRIKAHNEINRQIRNVLRTAKEYLPTKETLKGDTVVISYVNGFQIVRHILK